MMKDVLREKKLISLPRYHQNLKSDENSFTVTNTNFSHLFNKFKIVIFPPPFNISTWDYQYYAYLAGSSTAGETLTAKFMFQDMDSTYTAGYSDNMEITGSSTGEIQTGWKNIPPNVANALNDNLMVLVKFQAKDSGGSGTVYADTGIIIQPMAEQ